MRAFIVSPIGVAAAAPCVIATQAASLAPVRPARPAAYASAASMESCGESPGSTTRTPSVALTVAQPAHGARASA